MGEWQLSEPGLQGKIIRAMEEETEGKNYQLSALQQRQNNASFYLCSSKASATELKTWMVEIF